MTRVLVNVDFAHTAAFELWWDGAVMAGDAAPEHLLRLFAGAEFVEVTEQEGDAIRTWAARIAGWNAAPDNEKPLLFQASEHLT